MLMSVLFGELILLNARNRQERNDRERLFVQGVYLAQTIQQAVSGGINVTTNLSMFLQTSNYSPDLFDVWARELYTRNRGIGGFTSPPKVSSAMPILWKNTGAQSAVICSAGKRRAPGRILPWIPGA
jgi:hypothetical protein